MCRSALAAASAERPLRMGAHRGDEHQQHTENDRPHGHSVGLEARTLVAAPRRGPPRSLRGHGPVAIRPVTADRNRPTAGDALSTPGLSGRPTDPVCVRAVIPGRRGRRNTCMRHVTDLFLVLTGLADGLAPKEQRYAVSAISPNNLGPPLPSAHWFANGGGNSACTGAGC
jgi:hypothetical protein